VLTKQLANTCFIFNKEFMENNRGIVPKKVKGFRDINPNLNVLRWKIITAATKVYKSFGFEHWDTPIVEYADCLGKYLPDVDSTDQGIFSFRSNEEEPIYDTRGEELRDKWNNVKMEKHFLALRYDLTAPLARVYAESLWKDFLKNNVKEKQTPLFRRFQYGPVFRFEEKLDPGRFREFWQLDFDSVGTEDISADAEVCLVLSEALESIGIKRGTYLIKVNNRKVLKGFLYSIGITDDSQEGDVLRVIDKIDKIGLQGVTEELGSGRTDNSGAEIKGLGIATEIITKIVDFLQAFEKGMTRSAVLDKLKAYLTENEVSKEGILELEGINEILTSLDMDETRVIFDPTLVRGLAYYTGPVFEVESLQTYIDDKGQERHVGAIAAGGRYDGLVQNLLGIRVPATGASIGVDRLAELLVLTKQTEEKMDGPVLIVNFDDKMIIEYQKIAKELRLAGVEVEIFYGYQRQLKKQLAYADQKNCPIAILLGEDELKKGVVAIRNLKLGKKLAAEITDKTEWRNRVQFEVDRSELTNALLANL
jgi:histidyl-tRNA synthetase